MEAVADYDRIAKIAKLRAKAMSTAFPAEAESCMRKASILMERTASARRQCSARSMRSSAATGEDNRPMRARELWTLMDARGLYNRSQGRTPWATIASKLATDPRFERVAPGLYRLRR